MKEFVLLYNKINEALTLEVENRPKSAAIMKNIEEYTKGRVEGPIILMSEVPIILRYCNDNNIDVKILHIEH